MVKKSDININIMAHPKRKKFVTALKKRLGGDVTVIWDQKNCVWDTRQRCLLDHIEKGKKWSLTLQDDCLVTDNFIDKVVEFMNEHDRKYKRVYSFNFYFWARETGLALRAKRKGYYRGRGMKSGLAICLKTDMIPDLLDFWAERDDLLRHDDSRIGRFLRSRMLHTYYPCPSLVQHRDSESLIHEKHELPDIRQALFFI